MKLRYSDKDCRFLIVIKTVAREVLILALFIAAAKLVLV